MISEHDRLLRMVCEVIIRVARFGGEASIIVAHPETGELAERLISQEEALDLLCWWCDRRVDEDLLALAQGRPIQLDDETVFVLAGLGRLSVEESQCCAHRRILNADSDPR